MKILGVVLVAIGIIALVYGGISYSKQKTIIEIGSLKATTTEHKNIPLSPIAGVIALVGGIALIASTRKASA